MIVEWHQDELGVILGSIIKTFEVNNLPRECALEIYHDFIEKPRRHSSFRDAWNEYMEETSKNYEAQEGESTVSVTILIKPNARSNKSEDFEADKEVEETLETPKGEEEVHTEDEEPSQTKETVATKLERFKETLK
jgi:hypothetical protein